MKYSAIIAIFALVVSVSAARSTGTARDSKEILKDILAESKRSFDVCEGYANDTADEFAAILKTNAEHAASLLRSQIDITRGKADHILEILAHAVQKTKGLDKIKRQAANSSGYLKSLIDLACAQFYDIAYNAGSVPDEYKEIGDLTQKLIDKIHKELQPLYSLLDELAASN